MTIKELNKTLDDILELGDKDFDSFLDLVSKFAKIASMVQAMLEQNSINNITKVLGNMDTSDIDGLDDSEISDILTNLDPNTEGKA